MASEEEKSARLFEALENIARVISNTMTWPLDKAETFAAFALMGLASRLQPVQSNDPTARKIIVALAKSLGEDMAAATEKK